MPEIWFSARWPDGERMRCYSPSLVVRDYLAEQTAYPVADFVARARAALTVGSERVRAKYGFGCGAAAVQLEAIEEKAATLGPDVGSVLVEGFEQAAVTP